MLPALRAIHQLKAPLAGIACKLARLFVWPSSYFMELFSVQEENKCRNALSPIGLPSASGTLRSSIIRLVSSSVMLCVLCAMMTVITIDKWAEIIEIQNP